MKRFLFAFKVYYLVYVLLAFNAFVNEKKYMEWATYLLALWGMAAAAAIVLKYKEYKDMYNIWLIIGMIMSYVLSSLLSFRYGVTENIKEIVWMICFMFVLYSSCHTYTVKEMKKEFSVLAAIWTHGGEAMDCTGPRMGRWWNIKSSVLIGEDSGECMTIRTTAPPSQWRRYSLRFICYLR